MNLYQRWRGRRGAAVLVVALLLLISVLTGCMEASTEPPSTAASDTGASTTAPSSDATNPSGASGSGSSAQSGSNSGGSKPDFSPSLSAEQKALWMGEAFERKDAEQPLVTDRAVTAPPWAERWRLPGLNLDAEVAKPFSERVDALEREIKGLYEHWNPKKEGVIVDLDYRYRVDFERRIGGLIVAGRVRAVGTGEEEELASRVVTLSVDLAEGRFLDGEELNTRFGYETLYDRLESAVFELAGEYFEYLDFEVGLNLFSHSLLRFWQNEAVNLVYVPRVADGVGDPPAWWEVKSRSYGVGEDGSRQVRGHTHEDNPMIAHGKPRSLVCWIDIELPDGDWSAAPVSPDDFYAHAPHLNPDYVVYADPASDRPEEGEFVYGAYLGRLSDRDAIESALTNFLVDAELPPDAILYVDARKVYGEASPAKTLVHLIVPKYFETVTTTATPGPASIGTVVVLTPEREEPNVLTIRYRGESLEVPLYSAPRKERVFPEGMKNITLEIAVKRSFEVPQGVKELIDLWSEGK